MRRLRHLFLLLRDVGSYAVVNRVTWVIPLFVLLLTAALLVTISQIAAPFIYTVF